MIRSNVHLARGDIVAFDSGWNDLWLIRIDEVIATTEQNRRGLASWPAGRIHTVKVLVLAADTYDVGGTYHLEASFVRLHGTIVGRVEPW